RFANQGRASLVQVGRAVVGAQRVHIRFGLREENSADSEQKCQKQLHGPATSALRFGQRIESFRASRGTCPSQAQPVRRDRLRQPGKPNYGTGVHFETLTELPRWHPICTRTATYKLFVISYLRNRDFLGLRNLSSLLSSLENSPKAPEKTLSSFHSKA